LKPLNSKKGKTFEKLGRRITKRKTTVIFAWVILLVIIVPFVLDLSGVISLQMNSASDKNLESARASSIISAQFSSSVANDTLVIVVNSPDVSSTETQNFINRVTSQIQSSSGVSGLESVNNIYTVLIEVINQTNQGVYTAYDNANLTCDLFYGVPQAYTTVWSTAYNQTVDTLISGLNQTNQGVSTAFNNANLTYNLLYGVPTAYSTIWSTAYNQTQDTLTAGIVQTNQGVYATFDNANMTYNLLYGVPAAYLNVWSQAYAQTQDVATANSLAYNQTAALLYQQDPESFAQYTSPLLDAFYGGWSQSFQDPNTAQLTPIERASIVSNQTNQLYINTFLAGNETAKQFATALISSFTLENFLTSTQAQNNAALTDFAIQFVTTASDASKEFVTAAYNLGRTPTESAVNSLSEAIIWNPQTYNMGQDFIATFNDVSYQQTASILSQADPESFTQYTSHLLDQFNAAWEQTFPAQYTPVERATIASAQANQQFIDQVMGNDADSKAFATALAANFTLQNYLTNTPEQNNVELLDFALEYVAGSSNASAQFVTAAYDLGSNPTQQALSALAEDIIWNPQTYNMGEDFVATFNEVSYNQTATILQDLDEESFNQYSSHLLDFFNASWSESFHNATTADYTVDQRSEFAIAQALPNYIDAYLSDNKDFGYGLTNTLSLNDYLTYSDEQKAEVLQNFAISYVSNSSGLSQQLISAVFNLGSNCSETSMQNLASAIVANPDSYNLGEQLNSALDSLVAPNGEVALISIGLDESNDETLSTIRDIIKTELANNPGNIESALVTGENALNKDFGNSATADLDLILPVTIGLLLVATGLFFRSIVTPLVTLGSIGVGLGISMIFIVLIGTFVNQVDFMIPTILLTVLIGVGTDYSIFIIARHREELMNGLSVKEAIVKSVAWAGESIATSGTTVIISFLGLAATSIILLQTLGLIVGAGVIVALGCSLTLVPALAVLLGEKLFWPNCGTRFRKYTEKAHAKAQRKGGYFTRSGSFSVKHAKVLILVAIVITVPLFYVYASTTPTYDFLGGADKNLESIKASNMLSDAFGGSTMFPTYVVVNFSSPLVENGQFNATEMAALQEMSTYLLSHTNIKEVTGPTMPYGTPIAYNNITNTNSSDYTAVTQSIGIDNKTALLTVEFKIDPYSSQALSDAQEIRTNLHETFDNENGITTLYVGGTTGGMVDVKNIFDSQFEAILPIVGIGVAVVLFIVLSSLLLPIFAVLSVLMSIVWTLAVTAVVFQNVYGYGLLFITPMILLVLLLGIGMDYNIFILTRIREETAKGLKLNDAIVHAIEQTGGIITAAAIILAGSLGALMLSSNLLLKEMGFAFAFSILIDALVVRTYLVPAVMSVMGKWNWYNPLRRKKAQEASA